MSDDLRTMTKKLQQLTPHYQCVLDILSESTTVLSGGLVLQTLLQTSWPTDIDILTTDTTLSKLPIGTWTKFERTDYNAIPGMIGLVKGTIPAIGGFTINVDIIQVKNIEEHIANYDFDFCKVSFDGEEFHIEDCDAVNSKSCVVKTSKTNLENRMTKYKSRGFKITVDIPTPTVIPELVAPLVWSDEEDDESF